MASTSLETMFEAAEGHAWFQLYISGDGSGTQRLVDRAQACGYRTLVLTLDVPEVGRRPRELRRGFKMPFRIGPRQFIDFAMHPRWSLSRRCFADARSWRTSPDRGTNSTEPKAGPPRTGTSWIVYAKRGAGTWWSRAS